MALREMAEPSLLLALDYLELLAEACPEKLEVASVRWHARFVGEAPLLTLAECQLALAALVSFRAGYRAALAILRRLLARTRPSIRG
jgi:hypothetical protein